MSQFTIWVSDEVLMLDPTTHNTIKQPFTGDYYKQLAQCNTIAECFQAIENKKAEIDLYPSVFITNTLGATIWESFPEIEENIAGKVQPEQMLMTA